jgi:hypothetical protein
MTSPGAPSVSTISEDLNHDEKPAVPRLTESPTQFTDDEDGEVPGKQNGESDSGSDQEETDDEYEGEDEGDEDEEPALKYERISGSIPDLLKRDSASALAIANKLMVIEQGFFYSSNAEPCVE